MKLATMLLACTAILVWAGDPWKDKKPAEWNEKDSAKVLTNSPWAKTTYAEISGGGMGGGRGGGSSMSGGGGGGGRRGGGGGGGGGAAAGGGGEDSPGGGGGGNAGPAIAPSGPKVTIRWETSEVMMEAFNRVEYSLLPKLREWSKEFYIVTAAGMPVRIGGGGRPGQQPGGASPQGDRPQMDPKQMMERFIQGTALKRKGKEPIHPVRIEMLRAGDQMVPMFFFPKSDAIVADDKEVAFESAFGPATIKAKFNLKDMLYEGKLSL